MTQIEIIENSNGTVTIPIKAYKDLKRRAEKYEKTYQSNAARGKKRWEGTTPEQRKAAMAELAAKRKAKS